MLQEAMDAAGLDVVDFVDVGIEVGPHRQLADAQTHAQDTQHT